MVEQSQRLVSRAWRTKETETGSLTVKVLSWNILCDSLADDSFQTVDKSLRVWDYRFPLIK